MPVPFTRTLSLRDLGSRPFGSPSLLFLVGSKIENVLGQTYSSKESNGLEGDVKFPPLVTVLCQTWQGMVVVVPSFAVSQDRNPPEVAAVVSGLVVLVSPHVGSRVDEPGHVQDSDHSNANGPNQPGNRQALAVDHVADASECCAEDQVDRQEELLEEHQAFVFDQVGNPMVCKGFEVAVVGGEGEPEHVSPPRSIVRRVWVPGLIAVGMVLAVVGCPGDRSTFASQNAEEGQRVLNPSGDFESRVGQQVVLSQADAQATVDPVDEHAQE